MKLNKLAKVIGATLGILLFSLLITGLTYAWFTWRSSNIEISGTSECFTINSTKGTNITQTIDETGVILFDEAKIISDNQITIKNGMALTGFTAGIDSNCTIEGTLSVNLNITTLNDAYIDGQSVGAFKYVIANYDPNTYTNISVSTLAGSTFDIIKTGSITSADPIELVNESLETTVKGYLVIFYVDGDLAMNDAGESTFSATIEATASQLEE